jgi:tRNA(Arg) A34 adenosine deaminase TadA
MSNKKYMRIAIEKAKEGIAKGQEPFGACIVKNDEIISVAHNTAISDHDVTAHAEMNAIREACRKLGTIDLSGCEIYATFKPCRMCQSACERANIEKIYYGVGPEDFDHPPKVYDIVIQSGFLKNECIELVRTHTSA